MSKERPTRRVLIHLDEGSTFGVDAALSEVPTSGWHIFRRVIRLFEKETSKQRRLRWGYGDMVRINLDRMISMESTDDLSDEIQTFNGRFWE